MAERIKLLIVEDNTLNRVLLKEILIADYDVLEAENGEDAISILNEYGYNISLILLDIFMPVMDGYDFLKYMRNVPSYSSIPVIVTTQGNSEEDEVKALSRGATEFISKPYNPHIILHRIKNIISLRESAALANTLQHDHLTKLLSREYFFQKAKEILVKYPDEEYDLVCSDIENFKLINDIHGIDKGDFVLKNIAKVFLEIPDEGRICCRFQGDQFVCLHKRPKEYNSDTFISVSNRVNSLTTDIKLVIKWGVYPVMDKSLPIEHMCDRALMAADSIKRKYGKVYSIYNDELRGKKIKEQEIINSMETSLLNNEFEVYLQPKVRLSDEKLIGAEALVRWNHSKLGLQMPNDFIPLFEQNGFITKLDQYIVERTCALIRGWKDKGLKDIPISVNISRINLYNPELPNFLLKSLDKYDLPPSVLHLEITESAYTDNPVQLIEMVYDFRRLGFIIEMDDFGSGYSSLNMLNELPIDILKLDRKFILSEMDKPEGEGILRFIIMLAKWIKLDVIAEGIETEAQLERLKAMDCDYGQGYYFAKPLQNKDFETLLSKTACEAASWKL